MCMFLWMLCDSRDIDRRLKAEGFGLVSIKGGYHKFGKAAIIVPHSKKPLPLGAARSIASRVVWIRRGMHALRGRHRQGP